MEASPYVHWFKSSYSGGSGTECVECAQGEGRALLRDSKSAEGPVIALQKQAWDSFVTALRKGELQERWGATMARYSASSRDAVVMPPERNTSIPARRPPTFSPESRPLSENR
ncbi:DUF397 domain-containing protein [Streptomyces sp. NPDC005799]|uniref:DUF397 domain-containing protein n=1 Tax=Streptomyces sp. NPDC005799 TaxID=3154678 RepID=UPI0033D619E0